MQGGQYQYDDQKGVQYAITQAAVVIPSKPDLLPAEYTHPYSTDQLSAGL